MAVESAKVSGKVALFVPCFVDQFYPRAGIAAVRVLERLGIEVVVPEGAACCGQPVANAGFERQGDRAMTAFVRTFAGVERVVVLSGSCAAHLKTHLAHISPDGARVAARTVEICAFLHDEIGLTRIASLGARFQRRVAVHVGCHALRALGLATPSEIQAPPTDKVRALLGTVQGLELTQLARTDECCGFGGSFAVTEPAVSAKMGRDRLRDIAVSGAEAVVSTDSSCLMHLDALARRAGNALPMFHVAEILAATTGES